ncbi:hypothetical protein MKW11_03560 [Gluconobacter frateurii]|uniref:hypothetical protein n=1 Tax=Gluconobacter frateurii TaxID=38308 RepID=UPI001F05561B|nr:hypothetical protein [Gluconobacter frateurii]UMM09157.1 hypothetical protein MKW11_03560 [Gluconobacter frateurii]
MTTLKRAMGFMLVVGSLFGAAGSASAASGFPGQAGCWTALPGEDERPDVTCRSFTEDLLRSLQKATPAQVTQILGVPGKDHKASYFQSANKTPGAYNGYIELKYTNGHVSDLSAVMTQVMPSGMASAEKDYQWGIGKEGCSDFPGSKKACDTSQ